MSRTEVVQAPLSIRWKDRAPTAEELDSIALPEYGTSGTWSPSGPQTPDGVYTPRPPQPLNDLEADTPPPSRHHKVSKVVPSFWYPQMNRWRVVAACLTYFANGLNDAAPGALIPYLEEWYSIGYAVVSLIFITNAVGFITAAFFTDPILLRLGRARALMASDACMTVGYVVIAFAPPFPVVIVSFLILGLGNALNLAYNNVFVANLANSTVLLGASHGSYGIGGVIGPILVTTMVAGGVPWARFYLVLIGVRICSFCLNGWAFWNYETEDLGHSGESLQRICSQQPMTPPESAPQHKMLWQALKTKVTILGALFIFAYQGSEVAESGWFISYLIQARGGDPHKVGYVTSGFWGGITVGRFVLTHVAHRVGERLFVAVMSIAVIALQLMAWFIPSIVGNSVAVAVLGLLLGPVYPCAQTIFSRLLPNHMQVTAIGFISSAGSSGGALVPFTTGVIAQAVGQTIVLHPICIAFFVLMFACWIVLPKVEKRSE